MPSRPRQCRRPAGRRASGPAGQRAARVVRSGNRLPQAASKSMRTAAAHAGRRADVQTCRRAGAHASAGDPQRGAHSRAMACLRCEVGDDWISGVGHKRSAIEVGFSAAFQVNSVVAHRLQVASVLAESGVPAILAPYPGYTVTGSTTTTRAPASHRFGLSWVAVAPGCSALERSS